MTLKLDRGYNTFESVDDLKSYVGLLTEKAGQSAEEKLEKAEKKSDDEARLDTPDDDVQKKKEQQPIYADQDKEITNIFEHIIIFTNDKDRENNKTLNNIYEAADALKKAKKTVPQLHIFLAEDVTFEIDEDTNVIDLTDGEEELAIDDKLDNTNTLVFARLGVQGEDQCEHVVQQLQDRGFLVLNPVRYAEVACNKYDSAVLFQKAEIPQPNFCLMNKDILYDEKLYKESMKQVYKEFTGDGDKDEKLSFVVKILDGHGGTGVCMLNGKNIMPVFQMVFAIDSERQLIVQKKEEADGGDIRVHVLTLRNKQLILAAMKRVKIKSDFRSNVSLGATAEPVELTPEQERIALETARVSKMPWCAVDIMPLVKGSNKELGDNVVLEINASPGTDGISEVIGKNFVNILLNELDDPTEFCLQDKTAGYIESVDIDFGSGPVSLLAKLDTGNGASASHVEVGKFEDNGKTVTFTVNKKNVTLEKIGESKAVTGDQVHIRPIVRVKSLRLGQRIIKDVPMAIVEKRNKNTNVLLNRELLSYLGSTVSPSACHILTQEMEKVKII